jgi:hypothetical protein
MLCHNLEFHGFFPEDPLALLKPGLFLQARDSKYQGGAEGTHNVKPRKVLGGLVWYN